ncbi:hypothetical protein B9N62_07115 [Campylobacter concisus]|uniref:Uncharacterized protein n=1 Tax=Campylobacter concisus TaxID=199 RepID=A0A1Y5MRT3_9BACT|nr:hypothetical protein [Campylobacter concisus]OUT11097.1 hypothetical protein B9N62_07115 [Campylobacter concisus]
MAADIFQNRAVERTQAAGLVRLVREFEEKGFEMRVSAKGELWGIRRASMIKGQKADYSKSMFKLVGKYIIRTADGKVIDTAA